MLWSGLETAVIAGVSLVVSVVMARILAPDAFGLVALLQIFIAIGQMSAEAGMTQTLVRMPFRTPVQEGSALAINLAAGGAAYVALWLCAPLIAGFFHQPELIPVARLIGVCIPLNAACVVQAARLTSAMRFRRLAGISVCSVCVSGLTGILLALSGAGVMALVWQQIALWGARTALLWATRSSLAGMRFRLKEAKELTAFSWKLMASGFIDTVWTNIYAPLVGRCFGLQATAMFWRAKTLASYAPQAFGSVLTRVSLPAMSHIRDERERATAAFRRLAACSAWVIMPVCGTLTALAEPMFSWVLTDKWLPAVPLFQVLCVNAAFYPLHLLNCTALNVWGRPDLFLRLEIIKKLIGLGALCVSLPFGVHTLCWGILCGSGTCLFINIRFARRYTGVGIADQVRLITGPILGAVLAAACAWSLTLTGLSPAAICVAGTCAGAATYLIFTKAARLTAPQDIRNLFRFSKTTTQ